MVFTSFILLSWIYKTRNILSLGSAKVSMTKELLIQSVTQCVPETFWKYFFCKFNSIFHNFCPVYISSILCTYNVTYSFKINCFICILVIGVRSYNVSGNYFFPCALIIYLFSFLNLSLSTLILVRWLKKYSFYYIP